MPKFKEGDVVKWSVNKMQPDYLNPVAIIGDNRFDSDKVTFVAWRVADDHEWTMGLGAGDADQCTLHPDPDKIWAEYCAWRMTHAE